MPWLLALVLVLLCALPVPGGAITYTPNIAWLMTLVMVAFFPALWPLPFAFCIGLLQDVMFATPLGSQALLTLVLGQLTALQAARQQTQRFRLRWLEAAGALVVWHLLLWFILEAVSDHGASLRHLLRAGLVNAMWYPVFYAALTRIFMPLGYVK